MLDRILDRLAERYPVAPATEEDLGAVVDLFHEVWPALTREAIARSFHHRFALNPSRGGGLLVCRDGKRLAGCIGALAYDLAAGAQVLPAASPVDLAVLPAYRTVGLGPLLVREVRRRDAVVLAANNNEGAQAIAERLGAAPLAACEVRRRWLGPRHWLHRRARGYGAGATVLDPERFDRLWEASRGEYAIAARRSASVLAWRYAANPRRSFLVHVLDQGSERLAYAVTTSERLRGPLRRAILVDFLFAPVPAEARLRFLADVVATVARRGAVCIDALANRPADVALLEESGFRPKGDRSPFLLYANPRAERHPELRRGEDWHLTFGDSDFYL